MFRARIRLARLGSLAAPPVIRVALALPFLRSGLTRWAPFPTLSLGTRFLFEEQFKLHILGRLVDLPAPLALAYVTAVAVIILPSLLLMGLGTRRPDSSGTRLKSHWAICQSPRTQRCLRRVCAE